MNEVGETEVPIKEKKQSEVFGTLVDARPIQKDLATRFPLDLGRIGKLRKRREGRTHPAATPESLFPYYFNNYEVARRHLELLGQELGRPLKILEIGCGTGWGSRYLSESLPGLEIVATNRVTSDKDREILDTAGRVFGKEVLEFTKADATRLSKKFG